jgi:hypothetical protein
MCIHEMHLTILHNKIPSVEIFVEPKLGQVSRASAGTNQIRSGRSDIESTIRTL